MTNTANAAANATATTNAAATLPHIRVRTHRRATPSERAERIAEAMGVAPFPSTFFRRDVRLSSGS